ncbi:MAG: Ig-like domain-containing protein, partial [Aeromicrobium sp.]
TNAEEALAGKLNRQIEELTASVVAASSQFDVVQDGRDVFLHNQRGSTLERIDPARATLTQRTNVPPDSTVGLGDGSLAILGGEGPLWVTDVSNELSLDTESVDPDLELGPGSQMVVSRGGTVMATSPEEGKLFTIDAPGADPVEYPLSLPENYELSAVGDVAVVLDVDADALITQEGERLALGADAIRLQQPGDTHDSAIVATGDGLLSVPLDGSEITSTPADIQPITDPAQVSAPVWLEGCAHGAWAGAQAYLRDCVDGDPEPMTIEQPTRGATLEFRVNENVIALNNFANGNAWIINATMRLVDNWDEVTPPEESDEEDGDEKSSRQSFEDTIAERTEQNRPPVARDDEYGVRPGRTTILPVLDNDTDPDGDVLVITNFSKIPPTIGTLDLIDGGRALQFTPGEAESGSATFRYAISDGREGGVDDAQVLIRIVPPDQNSAPEFTRTAVLSSEVGQELQYNVLVDWYDPDGDDIYLDAANPTSGDDVTFTPDGFITFKHTSSQPGEKRIAVVVSDGRKSNDGEIVIDVQPAGTLNPIGTPDYVETFVGDTTTFDPLLNDSSPSGEQLRLIGVDDVPRNATVIPNPERSSIAVTGVSPGTFYFTYSLAAGSKTSQGLVRVIVREDPTQDLPPVAVKDSAFLRAGETTSVRPLINDVSPSNKVLAIQSIDTSETAPGVKVELLNSTVVRVTSSAALTEQTQFSYTVSDGTQSATAGVTVVPVPPIVSRQPPVARDDRQTVRAGDIASVSVLDNDFHPDRQNLYLEPDLVSDDGLGGGLAFVNGDTVRFQAPQDAGEYRAVYRVSDQYGESATAAVTFVVRALDDENTPPVAATQTARTFQGSQVRIDVPLDGIDTDGDSVVLNETITSPPGMGRIVEVGPSHIIYEANPDAAGTDRFSYEIEDALGLKAIGEIVVGVIPRPGQASNPSAVDDRVEVLPGKTVSVDVLLNDSDPNNYTIALSPELTEVDPELVEAVVERGRIIVTAPEREDIYLLQYEITNGKGGRATAFVQVVVTKDAVVLPPTGEDYYVTRAEVDGRERIPVDIRSIVTNPNGRVGDLIVSVEGPNSGRSTVDADTGTVWVVPGERRHAVAYRVTDPEDETLTGEAFIIVPPAEEEVEIPPPHLRDDLEQQIIEMNSSGEWDLEDIVTVPSGQPARITLPETVRGSNGSGLAVDEDTLTFEGRPDYRGPASITFEVTDGDSIDDPNGRVATLTMPITVGDPEFRDTPPEFTAMELQIEAGEGAQTVNLRDATTHLNPAIVSEVGYTDFRGATDQIQGSLNGTTVSASADFGVQPGAQATFEFTLTYRDFEVPGSVTVTTVASTRPPVQAVTDELKGQRSVQSSINVLANDFNPFRADGEPLRVVDAFVENAGESAARLDWTEDGNVTVSPNASFIGVVSVVYTVGDATLDASRQVQGRFLLTVRDVPSQVAKPGVVEEDQAVVVSWKTPATNGEPILDYTIRWDGGSRTVGPDQASERITGLTNGTRYQFTITARNVLGSSTPSAQSDVARPFGQPSPPSSATISATNDGSGRVTMSWDAANGNGRDVVRYDWRLSDGQTGSVNALSATVATTVGNAYTFEVRAINEKDLVSEPRGSGGSATPTPG